MSNNKNASSQSSILNFFNPIISNNASKETSIHQKSFKKRVHNEIINNIEEYKKLENNLVPIKKELPPKTKNKKTKKKDIDIDSDSDSFIEDENNEEESTPNKLIKSNSKEKSNNESSSKNIDLNNFLKETLDNEFIKNPHSLNSNITKSFHGNTTKKSQQTQLNNKSSINKNKNQDSETEEDYNINEEEEISNEDGLSKIDFQSNPQEALPDFLKPENLKDKNGNRPDSSKYDSNTLYIPPEFLKKQTPIMKQFWEFKINNFDKILFFKLGRFYEMYFDDAIIGNQILNLNWMGNKLKVGFPEKALERRAEQLVEAGFKIAVIEQTETPEEMKKRFKKGDKAEKVIKRKICNVYTKGTFYNYDRISGNYYYNKNETISADNNEIIKKNIKNKFCLAIFCRTKEKKPDNDDIFIEDNFENKYKTSIEWGICLFDVTTLKFYLGKIEENDDKFIPHSQSSQTDENSFNKIKTILYNISPDEIICPKNNLPESIINFINNLSSKPMITYLKNNYKFNDLNTLCQKYFGTDFQTWDKVIYNQLINESENHATCISLYLTINYLENLLLAESILPSSIFYDYTGDINLNPNKKMIIDYQAIKNLELIDTKLDPRNPESGSLVEYLNKAVTPFGKRLLRNWILNPLYDIRKINERLDMIEDLIKNEQVINDVRNNLSKWPDIERQCTKFFKLSKDNNTDIIYYQDINKNRLKEFFNLLNFLNKCQDVFEIFEQYINTNKFKSNELIKKVTIGQGVPDLSSVIKNLLNNFHIVEIKDKKENTIFQIESKPGIYPEYDSCKEEIKNIKKTFDDILQKEKQRLNCISIQYAHTKTFMYELEIPESSIKNKRPKEYIFTTAKKGYMRFHTKEILENLEKLDEAEEKLKEISKKLNIEIFNQFYNYHKIINLFINSVAEIDCLITLAYISSIEQDKYSRPQFIDISDNNGYPYLELRNCIHPCLIERTINFIDNDIILGENGNSLIVMTGPNMGGKSTLLRQVCIAVIFAQIGCYVPAKYCKMTLVDRIFTRIGAMDKLIEGKSTFYIEMEETKNILENATINSLIIMDELGRGTSTQDGKIIAKTVLYQIENKLMSRCLFTTHYHDIMDWCKKEKKIKLYFMDSSVDEMTKDIKFKYKFTEGICPESYGIEVAKMAGIPKKILNRAKEIKNDNSFNIQ